MIRAEDTICYKVTESIEDIEKLVQTGRLDPVKFVYRLHQIRKDAQRMENGLKDRKKIMAEVPGLEEKYKTLKSGRKPKANNKISGIHVPKKKTPNDFHITIKDLEKNEVVFDQEVHGVVMSIVEKMEDISPMGEIDGQSQQLTMGHPLVIWYAYDQLRQAIEGRSNEIMMAIRQAILENKFSDPKLKKQVIDAANATIGVVKK